MNSALLEALGKFVKPLSNRIANMVGRAVLRVADDAKQIQIVQVDLLEGETRDDIERFQNYGFTSRPRDGAEAVVLFVGGRRDHGLCIAVDDRRHRLKNLESGEVAIYNDAGAKVVLKASGEIELTPGPGEVVSLAGLGASVAKGEALNTAITTLGTAIAAALTTMGAGGATPMPGTLATAAGTAITTAVTAFNSSAAAALSTRVKLS